jgi:hypothetical protein
LATAPATSGADIEVPLFVVVAMAVGVSAPNIETPGALMSIQVPQLENQAFESFDAVAPTVIALGSRLGE